MTGIVLASWATVGCLSSEADYQSNGERIFFTGRNDAGERISYTGGAAVGMMGGPRLTCASCHGNDARGRSRTFHMDRVEAPDIRWSSLAASDEHRGEQHQGYDLDAFASAVRNGLHEDGEPLSGDMPRWQLSDDDLRDLARYLQTLP